MSVLDNGVLRQLAKINGMRGDNYLLHRERGKIWAVVAKANAAWRP